MRPADAARISEARAASAAADAEANALPASAKASATVLPWASLSITCPVEGCDALVCDAQPRCPADVVEACMTLRKHVWEHHPNATDEDWASAGWGRCCIQSCDCLTCLAEQPGDGRKSNWRSQTSNHPTRKKTFRGETPFAEQVPAGHADNVARLGGNLSVTMRSINTAAALACPGSFGEAILLNGAKGGFLAKAAKRRLQATLPWAAPHCPLPGASAGAAAGGAADEGEDEGRCDCPPGASVPPPGLDIAWCADVPIADIRGIKVKMQPLPTRRGLRERVLQPCVHGIKVAGAHAANAESNLAECGYKFYIISHITIFGRAQGEARAKNAMLGRRAVKIAGGGGQAMWEDLVRRCGTKPVEPVGADDGSPPAGAPADLPRRTVSLDERELLLRAQQLCNEGNPGRALALFSKSAVGDAADPKVQRALLDLTPYAELPPPSVTCDVPNVAPIRMTADVVDRVIRRLPEGRARGTLLSNYELIKGTYAAGGREAWIAFFKAFAAGALADGLAALMRALRAVLLAKDDTGENWRPLGIGEAERRVGCACVASLKKEGWNSFYTSELPDIKQERLRRLRECRARVTTLEAAAICVSTRSGGRRGAVNATATSATRVALVAAQEDAELAAAPPNYPVQLCFAPNGAEILAHTLEGWCVLAPEDDTKGCDSRNMYNEADRTASFTAMRKHDAESVPVYRMLYAHSAEIYLDRTTSGAVVRLTLDEVCARADRLGAGEALSDVEDPDEYLARAFEDDEGELPPIFKRVARSGGALAGLAVTLALCSTRGFAQGCGLATHGACLPYFDALAHVAVDHPTTRVVCFGDDTYGSDCGSRLYAWSAAKEEACAPLGHTNRLDKEWCWSPESTLEHAPPDLPGSPAHKDGRRRGFKAAGCFFGDPDWARAELCSLMVGKYDAPLRAIDAMRDVGDVGNSRQIRHNLTTYCTSSLANHTIRAQRLSITTVAPPATAAAGAGQPPPAAMTCLVDDRAAASFRLLVQAADSPADVQMRALQQARLPHKIGGFGVANATGLAPAAHCASLLACWGRMRRWFPIFADVDIATDERSWLADLRAAYDDLRQRHSAIHATYAQYTTDLAHFCDGATIRSRFRPRDLAPLSAVPPLASIFDETSDLKPPQQRQLASIVHHEGWYHVTCAAREADARRLRGDTGVDVVPHREATRVVDVAQPYAGGWLKMLPIEEQARIRSDEWLFAAQYRLGLYISAIQPLRDARAATGDHMDPLGDTLSHEQGTHHGMPHDEGLAVVYAATRAASIGTVVRGDGVDAELHASFNGDCLVDGKLVQGHILDLGEPRQGVGGGDLLLEYKAWSSLAESASKGRPAGIPSNGATHAFGNTEEYAIWKNFGVKARQGDHKWDSRTGAGFVERHPGEYHDAIHNKHNELRLWLVNLFSGVAPGGVRHVHSLAARKVDHRDYDYHWSAKGFVPHHMQRHSAAVVTAVARRCIKRLPDLIRIAASRRLGGARACAAPAGRRPQSHSAPWGS